jgi:hypothetical protein
VWIEGLSINNYNHYWSDSTFPLWIQFESLHLMKIYKSLEWNNFKSRSWKIQIEVRFEVLTAVSTKMVVFWVVAPCSLVEVYQRFRGPCCIALMVEAAGTSETLLTAYSSPRWWRQQGPQKRW